MRTPLNTIIFFLQRILQMISQRPFDTDCLPRITTYSELMMSQLKLMETFIEDLLDLRLMRDGIMTLNSEMFDPKETLDMIQNIFIPQAKGKSIKIEVFAV